ncbi:MAG: DUF420 domain-containing protein [Haloferacaceae archaeon]
MSSLRAFARDHVPGLTAVLATASLALVFGAVGGAVPAGALPHAPAAVLAAIPHVNAVLSTVALATTLLGWRAIRRRRAVARHRALMLTSAVLFALFLVLYLYKVALEGPTDFAGPGAVYTFVYLPVLAVHMLFAIVCIPLLYYVLLLAGTHSVAELPRTNHPRVGRVAAALWSVSFALGDVVYLLLYVVY